MDTAAKLSAYAEKCGIEMHIMGVPKTIDNDLAQTDHTPGFGSAAKFVATTMQEIARDCAVYKVRAVTIVEIMGRDAGWLTAAAGLPRLNGALTADLIYLPEVDFDNEAFLAAVRAELEKKPNVTVAVSEGLRYADGRYVGEGAQSGVTDIFGHKYHAGIAKQLEMLVKSEIGCKVRSVELSLPQRCAAHICSKTDIDESVRIGNAAADAAQTYLLFLMDGKRELAEKYIEAFCKTGTTKREYIEKWLPIAAAAQMIRETGSRKELLAGIANDNKF